MSININETANLILQKILELEQDFQQNKGIILTESDLHCLLFHKLYSLFSHHKKTSDFNIFGSPLHSEITFLNENGKLFYKPDITIIEPENYSIIHSISEVEIKNDEIYYKPTGSKKFEFGGSSIIIELKFCRDEKGITNITSYKRDLTKIRKIKKLVEKKGSNKVLGILAIFNKTDIETEEFEKFIQRNDGQNDIHVKYYTGKVKI